MNIKEDLKNFYDTYAKKYHETRKKHWEEASIILNEIKQDERNSLKILEFGCGGGRFISYLNNNLKEKKIDYIGVDISSGLIKLAKKDNPKNTFVSADISEYIKGIKQESFDYIIGTESFQHIPTSKEKFFLMKNFYRTLRYDGRLIMTNRSLSNRFIKKYYKNILKSITNYVISFGKKSRKDIMVPRKTGKNNKEFRFYHIFGLKELENLAKLSGFVIDKLGYIQKDNSLSNERSNSRTSLLISSKKIFNT